VTDKVTTATDPTCIVSSSDKINMDTNPAYTMSSANEVNMSINLAYVVSSANQDKVQLETNPACTVSTAGAARMEDNLAYQTKTTNPGGQGTSNGVDYYVVSSTIYDKVQMDTNPAYTVSTAGVVRMEEDPAYHSKTTNPGGQGTGSGVDYYVVSSTDHDKVQLETNLAYNTVSTAGVVKMEDDPAYQTKTTNHGGQGTGSEVYYYVGSSADHDELQMDANPAYTDYYGVIPDDQSVKMTQNST